MNYTNADICRDYVHEKMCTSALIEATRIINLYKEGRTNCVHLISTTEMYMLVDLCHEQNIDVKDLVDKVLAK